MVSHGWDGGQVHTIWSFLAETENAVPRILLPLISDFQGIVRSVGFCVLACNVVTLDITFKWKDVLGSK